MDENELKGTARDIGGKVQDAVGGLTGDTSLQGKGKVNQGLGKAQDAYGSVVDDIREYTSQQPILALFAALGVGAALGYISGGVEISPTVQGSSS